MVTIQIQYKTNYPQNTWQKKVPIYVLFFENFEIFCPTPIWQAKELEMEKPKLKKKCFFFFSSGDISQLFYKDSTDKYPFIISEFLLISQEWNKI